MSLETPDCHIGYIFETEDGSQQLLNVSVLNFRNILFSGGEVLQKCD